MLSRTPDLTNLLEQTIHWNEVGNLGKHNFTDQRMQLQIKCLDEELNELKEAIKADDPVEAVDALCDILFVAAYATYLENGGAVGWLDKANAYDTYSISIPFKIENMTEDLVYLFEKGEYELMCATIMYVAPILNFDLYHAYENVVNSNFTKYPLTDDVMIGAEMEWFNTCSKYDDVCVEEYDGYFIFRCDGGYGKIVKPRTFVEPTLEQYIGK